MCLQVFHGDWRGREVAIKVMTQAGASRAVVDEFRREVSTMSALPDHPNVLRLLGACVQAPLALVTPYCQKCAASWCDFSTFVSCIPPCPGSWTARKCCAVLLRHMDASAAPSSYVIDRSAHRLPGGNTL